MKIAILGLGEAGSAFARDLVKQSVQVSGWDQPKDLPEGLEFARCNADAVKDADIILSANLASAALGIAKEVHVIKADQIFTEMNTGSPQLKQAVADSLKPTGAKDVTYAKAIQRGTPRVVETL